ncbi:hypothetical protein BB559_006018 [Furculomyces boomerangus]|uniref:2-hydroxyacyl-CoA lyase n=2 Tax=Harpellales TaxID=61421 RepID=A0A2T9Y595_9FUNG|nr:hypothetical protein BB559_006658 [Furculomyces boomerangus]PVU87500.1 hypothetical protein BB559_006018 [Furculomyces boomerangus]PWA00403.1 hypothetical protein BB558_003558 [Smittium angustum]
MTSTNSITGAQLIARSLKEQGVTVVFGLVGIPVIGDACISEGIKFIAFRNEQSARYMTGKPGVCLVVSGPGVVNALSGIINSQVNRWPMIAIGGSCETDMVGCGAFQELDQVALCAPYTKYSAKPKDTANIRKFIQHGFNESIRGKPGPVYLDFPADYITSKINLDSIIDACQYFQVHSTPDEETINVASDILLSAKSPLVIIGKGAALSQSEDSINDLIETTGFPFLPTPMGKGVVADKNPLNVSAARTMALENADVVLILGARLNWILHFGKKFNKNARIIQADIDSSEIGSNIPVDIPLVGSLENTVPMLVSSIKNRKEDLGPSCQQPTEFLEKLTQKIAQNSISIQKKFESNVLPMSYHRAFYEIKKLIPPTSIFISEGANTMDIARSVFDFSLPRRRLDAGTFATMGVGLGFSIAAQLAHPDEKVVAVVGDSAFGFSAMDVETAVRNKLPITFVVINNSGIYSGFGKEEYSAMSEKGILPPTALMPEIAYHDMAISFGADGYLVRTPEELSVAFSKSLESKNFTVINCLIAPGGTKKLEFNWMKK